MCVCKNDNGGLLRDDKWLFFIWFRRISGVFETTPDNENDGKSIANDTNTKTRDDGKTETGTPATRVTVRQLS